jgi:hypothetical protein
MRRNVKASLFLILFGFTILIIGIVSLALIVSWWKIGFFQILYEIMFIVISILLISGGIYLIAKFIS